MRNVDRSSTGRIAEVRWGTLAGIPAARVEVRCAHSTSRAFVITVHDERRNREAIDLAMKRQADAAHCACGRDPRARLS